MNINQSPQWQKSSFCGTNACIEIATVSDGGVLLRDSKHPDVAPFAFSKAEWSAFVDGVKADEFTV